MSRRETSYLGSAVANKYLRETEMRIPVSLRNFLVVWTTSSSFLEIFPARRACMIYSEERLGFIVAISPRNGHFFNGNEKHFIPLDIREDERFSSVALNVFLLRLPLIFTRIKSSDIPTKYSFLDCFRVRSVFTSPSYFETNTD